MIEVFIGNQGKYAENKLAVEPLVLPATSEALQAVFSKIGIDGKRYEEIHLTDCQTNVPGLASHIGEYESIDELNYLAALLEELEENGDLEKFEAAVSLGDSTGSLKELINLAQNLDCYELYPDVNDYEALGTYLINELGYLEIPEHIKNYFDYEAYGRDVAMDEASDFTDRGYICETGSSFMECYSGLEDLPDEYRISTQAEVKQKAPSILDALKQYRKNPPSLPDRKEKSNLTHNER